MLRPAPFVASAFLLLPQQAVVLQVVHHLQQLETEQALDNQERQHRPAQPDDQRAPQQHRQAPGLQVVVAPVPHRFVLALQALLFQVPGGFQAAQHGARQKLPEGFPEAGRGRVLRRGHPHMVAAVVLDEEVPVEHRRQRQFGQPLLQAVVLVAQLVAGIDGDAGGAAGGDRQPQVAVPGQGPGAGHPGGVDESAVQHRHRDVDRIAVIAVVLQLADPVFRRVGGFLAEDHVEQGNHPEHEQKPEPPHHRPTGELDHLHRAHRQQHGEGAQ